jgi:transcription initiation factor TFIID subunit 10
MASEAPQITEQAPAPASSAPGAGAAATAGGASAAPAADVNAATAAGLEPRLPTRKDVSLREFLNKMDDYAPIVCKPPFPRGVSSSAQVVPDG